MLYLYDLSMEHIEITNGGNVLSHIYSGESVTDIASLLCCYDHIFVILDQNLSYLEPRLTQALSLRSIFLLDASERHKDIRSVMDICSWLIEENADRDSFLLGIGGGITTDITGMAACIYKRGIRFGFLPTTLLAQTDAAIGGKNGVNCNGFKNMVGVIRQPEFTFECSEVLLTLPREDFISGEGELLKSFIIENRDNQYERTIQLLSTLHSSQNWQKAISCHLHELVQLIMAAAAVKAAIVGRDINEMGERRKLNLGHTFAHAIEWKSHNQISHGKAVAIGIIMAARLSEKRGLADKGLADKLEQDFQACGLPTNCNFPISSLLEAMEKDKKASKDEIRFILIQKIGKVLVQSLPIDIETLSLTI